MRGPGSVRHRLGAEGSDRGGQRPGLCGKEGGQDGSRGQGSARPGSARKATAGPLCTRRGVCVTTHATFMTGWAKYRALQSQKPVCIVAGTRLLCPAASSVSSAVCAGVGEGREKRDTSHTLHTPLCAPERTGKEAKAAFWLPRTFLCWPHVCILVAGDRVCGQGSGEPTLGRAMESALRGPSPGPATAAWGAEAVTLQSDAQARRCEVSKALRPLRSGRAAAASDRAPCCAKWLWHRRATQATRPAGLGAAAFWCDTCVSHGRV